IAAFAPFIANRQPLYVTYKGKTYYPAWSTSWVGQNIIGYSKTDTVIYNGKKEIIQFDITDWRKMDVAYILWPVVPFSPENPDYYNRDYVAPTDKQLVPSPNGKTVEATGKFRHLLGTDDLGRDVLAGIIHGARTSLTIGVFSMLLASIIGLTIGLLSGYFGDDRFKLSWIAVVFFAPAVVAGYFTGFIARSAIIAEAFEASTLNGLMQFVISLLIFIGIPALCVVLFNLIPVKKIKFPIDSLFSRATEVFNSLPKLLLIISLSILFERQSIWLTVIIIGCTSWTEIARLTRAELLKIRELDYIQAAKSLGIKSRSIMWRHALPNAMSSVFVTITFGVATAILMESALSFLGIGVPQDAVTWGSMLSHGRQEMEAWWLLLYPGLALFLTTLSVNLLGEGLRDALDPKLKGSK
ncbi:MAG TPA: ABC transporter permease, partial [Flavobacteriales bacterium]|nr:ABC transporter permease [Flavobacteriales bacterium]